MRTGFSAPVGTQSVDFTVGLIEIYREEPCRVAPNAIWKTLARIPNGYSHIQSNDHIENLQFWTDTELLIYWDRTGKFNIQSDLNQFNTIILHDLYLEELDKQIYPHLDPYFRLYFPTTTKIESVNTDYQIELVQFDQEWEKILRILRASYPNWSFDRQRIEQWRSHPTYDPELWIWVIDPLTSEKIALGIAEYYTEIKEGSLEWIQVHPDHQKKGVGKIIVMSLVQKLLEKADIITVSGQADQPHLQQFYEDCGFTGNEIWWVARR